MRGWLLEVPVPAVDAPQAGTPGTSVKPPRCVPPQAASLPAQQLQHQQVCVPSGEPPGARRQAREGVWAVHSPVPGSAQPAAPRCCLAARQ